MVGEPVGVIQVKEYTTRFLFCLLLLLFLILNTQCVNLSA